MRKVQLSKKTIFIISLIIFVAAAFFIFQFVLNEKTLPKKPLSVHATVLNAPKSLAELKSGASLIVSGEVVSQREPSTFAVASEVKVNQTHKGNKYDSLTVFQLGQINEETIMEEGKTYLLFLNSQEDGVEENFHIVGDQHGLFYTDKKGNLHAEHQLMQEEMNLAFHNSVSYHKKNKSKFELWLEE